MSAKRRIRRIGGIVLGSALVAGLVSAFLPWLTESYTGSPSSRNVFSGVGGGLLYFFIILDAGAIFVIGETPRRLVFSDDSKMALPVTGWLLYLVGGIGALGSALHFFFIEVPEFQVCYEPGCTSSTSPAYGSVVALVAALAVCAGAILKRTEPQLSASGRRVSASSLYIWILGLDALAAAIFLLMHIPTLI